MEAMADLETVAEDPRFGVGAPRSQADNIPLDRLMAEIQTDRRAPEVPSRPPTMTEMEAEAADAIEIASRKPPKRS